MTLPELIFALLALLLTPGPTNTLLALAAAADGWRGARRLIPAELAGYLAVVVPLALLGERMFAGLPMARMALGLLAAVWVMGLAVRMWRLPEAEAAGAVTPAKVFVTTLLNPKALVIGLVLLPGTAAGAGAALPVFAATVPAVAALWIGFGAAIGGRQGLPPLLRRGAACWLAVLALGLAAGSLHG